MKQITLLFCFSLIHADIAIADEDYNRALKRAQYLLTGSLPTDEELAAHGSSRDSYRLRLREFIAEDRFYKAVLRLNERIFGTALPINYIDELQNENIDDRENKFARIRCERTSGATSRLRCIWSSILEDGSNSGQCAVSKERPISVFWYPGIVAWACPSVIRTCGHDLSRCFVEYPDEDIARNSELGTTEAFDSRFSVTNSLSRQAAGIATRLAFENYPYRLMLKSGLTAVDGAVAHFYKQGHHFKIDELRVPNEVVDIINSYTFNDVKFTLVNTNEEYESAGVLSTFGWLRRYDKHRTRGNELYERLLCRKFTSELPRVFPQDPGNLRETAGCSGCHATLDPLADFFRSWGEGGEIYAGEGSTVETTFAGESGRYISDLANIISSDTAFATCTTMHVWEWLMGRQFYFDEAELRAALTNYFINTQYSFRELVYAIASHPAFMEGERSDGTVGDPLEEPPLGEVPNDVNRECDGPYDWATDIQPSISLCTQCHNSTSSPRVDLSSESNWVSWGSQAVDLMASNQMPPGEFGPEIFDFKETVRCWLEEQ